MNLIILSYHTWSGEAPGIVFI
jgi:hypothetical protein